ncbi:MAG: hypothetical protein II713_01465 [Clostridia bacterium]|nr:hypothetical protein [Clostridia bacterium]
MERNRRSRQPEKTGLNKISRRGVEHGFSILSLWNLIPVFFLIAVLLLIIPRAKVSNIEKRELAKFPKFSISSLFSGEFTEQLGNYYNDTVPARDSFKTAGYRIKALFGIHPEDEVKVIVKPENVTPNTSSSSSESSQSGGESSLSPSGENSVSQNEPSSSDSLEDSSQDGRPVFDDPDAEITENGLILTKQNGHWRALEVFGGGSGNAYVEALNNFRSDLPDSVRIYSMVIPKACEYYIPSSYADTTVNQKEVLDAMAERFAPGINYVEVETVLGRHVDEEIYLRTDHHWTPLGAYYAAQEFADKAGVPFKNLSTYEAHDIEGFVGTMYAFSRDVDILDDPETFTYYTPENLANCTTYFYDTAYNYTGSGRFFQGVADPQSNAYLTFMGGDELAVKVKTDVKNGRKLLIVKDSYGNAVPGYLFGSFEEIYVVDMRNFQCNLVDFIEDRGVTDVLFTMVTYSAVGGNADSLEVLRTQAKGEPIYDGAEE